MHKLARLATILVGIVVSFIAISVVVGRLFFSSVVIKTGSFYDFAIGQTREQALQTAERLVSQGRAVEIHTWPVGEFHRPFRDGEIPAKDDSPRWAIVVDPDWWNNTITLTFENGHVIEIRRSRVLFELP